MNSTKGIWFSWTEQIRNAGIASGINCKLYTFSYERYTFLRYPLCIVATMRALFKERPQVCCAMLPSVFCALLLSLFKSWFRYKLIVDLHTLNTCYLLKNRVAVTLFTTILHYCLQKADLIIVTNDYYGNTLGPFQDKIFSLPDKIPQAVTTPAPEQIYANGPSVLCVSSFDPDEPYEEMFEAAGYLEDITLLFSGNYTVLKHYGKQVPSQTNIRFTGFLPFADYYSLFLSTNAVMVLTKLEGCLCCGAYEALAYGRPLIVSDTQANRALFQDGPVYTENRAEDIAAAVHEVLSHQTRYSERIKKRAEILEREWQEKIVQLNSTIDKLFE